MADKKDKTKETKGGDQKKTAVKAPKAAGKTKAPAKTAKKDAAAGEGAQGAVVEKRALVHIPTPRLKQRYHDVAVPALMKEFSYKNPMQAPKLVKVVLNEIGRAHV
jgi:large subunit ribosomal protein L5